jgi:preprotein translocase subunit SecF
MQIFTNTHYDFVRWRWHAIAVSLLLIAAGIATVATRGLPMGVDFEGGTIVIVRFEQMPQIQEVRAALSAGMVRGGEAVVQQYGPAENRDVMIRVRSTGEEIDGQLSAEADAVIAALQAGDLGPFRVEGTEIVGPVIGEQLRRQGTLATVLALTGILLYIAFRFQLSFAIGAVAAVVHDLAIVMSFLVFFQYELSLNVIAGLLTITGYSVNDTIVVFDRVRENLRSMRRDNLPHIVNVAVNQTLARTVITAGTTILAVLALFIFGGEVLRGFAFTMLIGVIAGTYSTVFIAAAVAILLQGKKPLKGQIVAPAAVAVPEARRPTRRRAS